MPDDIETTGGAVEETQVPEEAADTEQAAEETAAAADTEPAYVAALREQVAELKGRLEATTTLMEKQVPQEPEEAPYKPMFSEEQVEELDDGQKPFAKALNVMHQELHDLKKAQAEIGDSQEDAQLKAAVRTFISENPEIKSDAKKAKAAQDYIDRIWVKGDYNALLEVIKGHLLNVPKKPAPPDPAAQTQRPKSVAGSVAKAKPPTPKTIEQGIEQAKKEALAKLRAT